jgi:SAM-dependent methyltransferase
MHQSSLDKMTDFRDRYLAHRQSENLRIFDLGSMDINGSYRPLFFSPNWRYQGLDLAEGENVDLVLGNPYRWPEIPSGSADVVISGQAFEHIEFFWVTMLEIERILKRGGICCIISPSGGPEHRYPVDCWRFFPDGFAALARFAQLKTLEIYTQRVSEPEYKNDDSNLWKDVVLICAKEPSSIGRSFLLHIRRWALLRFWELPTGAGTHRKIG